MNRSRLRRALAFVALLAVLVFLANRLARKPPVPVAGPTPVSTASRTTPDAVPVPEITRLPVADEAVRLNAPGGSANDDLELLGLLISDFRRHQGGNPVGENEEISAALQGKNPKGLAYLPADGPFLDAKGRLVDRWGTPYFFHALAADRLEIRSAGPDKEFWTDDDAISGP